MQILDSPKINPNMMSIVGNVVAQSQESYKTVYQVNKYWVLFWNHKLNIFRLMMKAASSKWLFGKAHWKKKWKISKDARLNVLDPSGNLYLEN